jgi:hypothetical protein
MSREEKLAEFVGWAQHHITGDEKGQAQIFLDRLFQAFGHPSARPPKTAAAPPLPILSGQRLFWRWLEPGEHWGGFAHRRRPD